MAKKANQGLAKRNEGLKKAGDTPIPDSGLEVSLVLNVGDEELILTGKSFKGGITVDYKRPWDEAAELGTFNDGLVLLGKAIGNATLAADVKTFIEGLPTFLGDVLTAFTTAKLILTDLKIDTSGNYVDDKFVKKNVYELGIGLKFTQEVKAGNITLKAFLVKYSYNSAYVPPPPPPPTR